MMLSEMLRGAADFVDAVNQALTEQRTGFSEREAGDYLDAAGLADAMVPDEFPDVRDEQINMLAAKLHRIRGLADGWRASDLNGSSPGDLVLHVASGTLLDILNEGINFWTPPEADDVVDAEVHCEGCRCPSICGCGRAMYADIGQTGVLLGWFHVDDETPVTDQCRRARDGLISRDDSRPRTQPSPRRNQLTGLMSVGHEDLSAHIFSCQVMAPNAADQIASDLLADYVITPRKK